MQTYSQDLRDRVLRALDRGDGPTEIARRFEVKALVELALQPGMSVAKLARQHDMNANVLRKWIASALGQETSAVQQPDPSTLVPVKLTESARPEKRARSAAELSFIEMEVDGATIRVHGAVDAAQLGMVLDCVRRR